MSIDLNVGLQLDLQLQFACVLGGVPIPCCFITRASYYTTRLGFLVEKLIIVL